MLLNPLMLIGFLAAGVPLLIHLMHRRESLVIDWPSLKFLAASNRRTARRRRVEEFVLLALRMALFFLLSVALARPVLRAGGILGEGAETAAVIVLDNSMSMSASVSPAAPGERTSRFAAAKAAAEKILKSVPAGGRVALRLADGTEPAAARAISRNREAAVFALRAAGVSDARGDMGAAVAEAISDAAASDAPNAEVYVLTDMQAAAFARAPLLPRRAGGRVTVIFVDCGREPLGNVAVTALAVRARRFVAGAPLGVDVRLRNFSQEAGSDYREERRAVLEFDGEAGAKAERQVSLGPGGTESLTFQMTPSLPGEQTGRVYVTPADGIAADDTRYFRVHLAERIPVLVVERSASTVETARASFFLANALRPGGPEGRAGSPVEPKVVGPAYAAGESARELLAEAPVAVLADLGEMADAEARAWVGFVREGGMLVAFPSASGDAGDAAAALERAAGTPFLPAGIGEAAGDARARDECRRIDVERSEPTREDVLAPFRELDATLRAVSVWRAYDLRPTHAAAGRTVLALEGGGAFLAARRFGEGEVYLFAVPVGLEWSDLPARSLFLPLVHSLVYRAAAPRGEERSFLAGTSPRVGLPAWAAGAPVTLARPDGRDAVSLAETGTDGIVTVAPGPLDRAGVYRVSFGGPVARTTAADVAFVVNIDPEESDPARIGLARLAELYAEAAGAEPVLVEEPEGLDAAISRVRKGFELWDYLLALALSVALFETFFSNRVVPGTAGAVGIEKHESGK